MTINLTKYDKNRLFNEFLEYLEKKQEQDLVPVSIFARSLTPFEALCKYCVDYLGLGYSELGRALKKDRQVIWTTYRRASKKMPGKFSYGSDIKIPLKKFVSDDLSIFELLVQHLKEAEGLSYSEIAAILDKSPKTIWTIYSRVRKKNANA